MTPLRRSKVSQAAEIASKIRRALKKGGSAEHAKGVQWFFKEEVKSHGWYTGDLRRFARKTSREIAASGGIELTVRVADRLFAGENLEEKAFAVLLLEKSVQQFGEKEFRLFESWLARVSSWADHDALVHYLIGPLIVVKPARKARVFVWAKSKNRWHRRAAAVALIQGTRKHLFFREIQRVTERLRADEDDMVQKGLGWLLRETAKADPRKTVPYLLRIRERVPRFVLRTACETLPREQKHRVLAQTRERFFRG